MSHNRGAHDLSDDEEGHLTLDCKIKPKRRHAPTPAHRHAPPPPPQAGGLNPCTLYTQTND